MTRRRTEAHTALFFMAMFAALGAHLPFWPLWLADWGLSPGEIGVFTTLGFATRVIAGMGFPALADRLDQRRLTTLALCLAAAAIFAAHLAIAERWFLLLATMATGAAISGIMPLGEALGAGAARAHGFAYAPPRALGSVAFLGTSFAVGALIGPYGADAILWWIVAFFVVTALLARRHPGGGTVETAPPGWAEIARLLREPTFALFTLAAALCLSSHAVYYVYGSVHWRALGLSEATIGALWAFAVAVEVALMFGLGPRAMAWIGPVGAIALSGAAGVVRWGAMMADPTGPWLWALQALHALTFALGHLGAIAFILAAVPERYGASAQGAFMGLGGGIATALAMGLAALAYPVAAGLTYAIAAAMSAAGLAIALILARRWTGATLQV